MFRDFKELLSLFNARKVKYLVVGGYAVSFHGQPRATSDLDLFIKSDRRNADAAYMALAEFGADLQGIRPDDLIEQGHFFTMGAPPMRVDLLTVIDGVTFKACWQKRAKIKIDRSLYAFTISRADLIANKVASGRPQDMADVAALQIGGTAKKAARHKKT